MNSSRRLEQKTELNLTSEVDVVMAQNPSKKTELESVKGADIKFLKGMKKIYILIAFVALGFGAKAQLKIDYYGSVGVGIDPYWIGCKFRLAYGGNDFAFMPNFAGVNFGAYNASDKNATRIDFYHPIAGWNKVRFKGYTLGSDSTLKTDIMPLEDVTNILKRIKTYSYYFKTDCQDTRKRDYGVLAQELETILPELIDTSKGTMFVNYNAFFGILIKGFNEQQNVIETQQKEIGILQQVAFGQELDLTELIELRNNVNELRNDNQQLRMIVNELRNIISICCKETTGVVHKQNTLPAQESNKQSQIHADAVLYQNTPNPFSSNTEISCNIPVIVNNAFIYVYNLQGIELKSFPVKQGINTVTISASELPAGMYLYTLVVDNEIIDSKRMILTK
jgi:cell fate (sporulation/competence/biofilm development) regulator YlbF (YheA/YmcA/DUF963 family)